MLKRILSHCKYVGLVLFGCFIGYVAVLLFSSRTSQLIFSQEVYLPIDSCPFTIDEEKLNEEIRATIARAERENGKYCLFGFAKIRPHAEIPPSGNPYIKIDFAMETWSRSFFTDLFSAEPFSGERELFLSNLYDEILHLVEEEIRNASDKTWRSVLEKASDAQNAPRILSEFLPLLIINGEESADDLQWLSEQKNCGWKILFLLGLKRRLSEYQRMLGGCAWMHLCDVSRHAAEYFLHDDCSFVRNLAREIFDVSAEKK